MFLAEHAVTGELRVVKFLAVELAGRSEMVRRFKKESQILVNLKSAHICRVLDVGEVHLARGQNVPYFVMDYLKGETLHSFLKRFRAIGVERLLVIGVHHFTTTPSATVPSAKTSVATPRATSFLTAPVVTTTNPQVPVSVMTSVVGPHAPTQAPVPPPAPSASGKAPTKPTPGKPTGELPPTID